RTTETRRWRPRAASVRGDRMARALSRVLHLTPGAHLARLHQEAPEPLTQFVHLEAALDLTVHHERHGSRFFRDDKGDSVVLFREADGRAMPRPELLAQPRIHRQREKARGRRD